MTILSPRIANQEPVGSFAMPVSALRFEPLVDVQARNLGEAQADITIRGGIFENTGFRVGGVSLYDPQTGHYFAEIPVAPAMLTAPQILTGTDNAVVGFNADVGTVAYGWRPITTRGEVTVNFGDHDLERQSFYQGYVSSAKIAGRSLAADTEFSRSSGDGTIRFGDQHFARIGGRLQLADNNSQTDLFYGYQKKFFGWPNLYTPFGVHETENLQTGLLALNHRVSLGADDFMELGAFYRRNKDDYEYSRESPGLYNPYQHTTWARGASVSGRNETGPVTLNYSAEVVSDNLASTSLVFGHFKSRTYYKAGLLAERNWAVDATRQIVAKAGLTCDDTNRDGSALSPTAELALIENRGVTAIDRYYFSYAKTTQVPTYTALNSSPSGGLFRGNPNLGRETAQNLEIGWSQARGVWSVRSAVFYRRDTALTDWTYSFTNPTPPASGPIARTANAVDIDTFGFESVATYTTSRFKFVLGYTFLNKAADYRGAAVDASYYALNFARHRLTAAIVARLGAGFELRMDNIARIQQDDAQRKIGGNEALLSSLGVFYLPKSIPGLEVSFAADNLWASNFQEVPAVPASGRQISSGVTYRW